MIQSKETYLQRLAQSLPITVNKEDIIREYDLHIEDKLADQPHLALEDVLEQLGDPVELAEQYEDGEPIAKGFVSNHFVFCNLLFFLIGGLLTVCYHLFEGSILSDAWGLLAQIPLTIVVVYTVFWMVLGFEIGREYGLVGKEVFSKTVFLCLVPNVLLMILTLFKCIPTEWFQPILTPAFIVICVIMTIMIYPISKVFYYLGVYRSV